MMFLKLSQKNFHSMIQVSTSWQLGISKPLNKSKAKGDLVVIQTLLLFKYKLPCYHANQILMSITTRSPSASLEIEGLATKYTTVKWSIVNVRVIDPYLFPFITFLEIAGIRELNKLNVPTHDRRHQVKNNASTLHLTSVFTFFQLFSKHFLRFLQGEFA